MWNGRHLENLKIIKETKWVAVSPAKPYHHTLVLFLGVLKCLPFRMFLSLARRLILSLTCLVNEIEFLLTSRSCSSGHNISCCSWIGSLLFLCPQPTKTDTKVNGKMTKNTVKGSSSTWTEAKCIRVSGLLIFLSVVQWKTLVVTRHQHQQLTPFPRSVHSFVMFLTRCTLVNRWLSPVLVVAWRSSTRASVEGSISGNHC